MIYGGGAVDAVRHHDEGSWPHILFSLYDVQVYCPRCAVEPGDTDERVMSRNRDALLVAEWAAFLFDGTFTVGTPIEVEWRLETVWRRDTTAIINATPLWPGLFMRRWRDMGAVILNKIEEVPGWLARSS